MNHKTSCYTDVESKLRNAARSLDALRSMSLSVSLVLGRQRPVLLADSILSNHHSGNLNLLSDFFDAQKAGPAAALGRLFHTEERFLGQALPLALKYGQLLSVAHFVLKGSELENTLFRLWQPPPELATLLLEAGRWRLDQTTLLK